MALDHDPENAWPGFGSGLVVVFNRDHAHAMTQSGMTIERTSARFGADRSSANAPIFQEHIMIAPKVPAGHVRALIERRHHPALADAARATLSGQDPAHLVGQYAISTPTPGLVIDQTFSPVPIGGGARATGADAGAIPTPTTLRNSWSEDSSRPGVVRTFRIPSTMSWSTPTRWSARCSPRRRRQRVIARRWAMPTPSPKDSALRPLRRMGWTVRGWRSRSSTAAFSCRASRSNWATCIRATRRHSMRPIHGSRMS